MVGVDSVEDVLEDCRLRMVHREDDEVGHVKELGIHWCDQDTSHSVAGWYATIGGREKLLSHASVRNLSKMVRVTDLSYWNQFSDKDAFSKTLNHVFDNRRKQDLIIRHDALQVQAVLPSGYIIKDAYEMLSDFTQTLQETFGEIVGVTRRESREVGDWLNYGVVVGRNIVPELSDKTGQFTMFALRTSETGYVPTMAQMGFFRSICTNSALNTRHRVVWDHCKGEREFIWNAGNQIQEVGYMQDQRGKIFSELLNRRLTDAAMDLLVAMKRDKLITAGHYKASELYADLQTEDGREVETEYDFFNVLTRGAQDIVSNEARLDAESRSYELCCTGGGVYSHLKTSLN